MNRKSKTILELLLFIIIYMKIYETVVYSPVEIFENMRLPFELFPDVYNVSRSISIVGSAALAMMIFFGIEKDQIWASYATLSVLAMVIFSIPITTFYSLKINEVMNSPSIFFLFIFIHLILTLISVPFWLKFHESIVISSNREVIE